MALSEQSRNEIYTYLAAGHLGEKAINEMLSYFPARDVEEPVTKEFLRSELALVRIEFREEMATLRADVANDMVTLRNDLTSEMRRQFFWLMSTIFVALGIMTTLIVTLT